MKRFLKRITRRLRRLMPGVLQKARVRRLKANIVRLIRRAERLADAAEARGDTLTATNLRWVAAVHRVTFRYHCRL